MVMRKYVSSRLNVGVISDGGEGLCTTQKGGNRMCNLRLLEGHHQFQPNT